MNTEIILEQHSQKVNLILDCQTGFVGKYLSADETGKVTQLITSTVLSNLDKT